MTPARTVVRVLVTALLAVSAAAASTLPVEIPGRVPFSYKRVFTVGAPLGWRTHDQSEGARALVTWSDSTGNGALQILVVDQGAPLNGGQQARYLSGYLQKAFARAPQFRKHVKRGARGPVATWSYLATGTRNERARLQGRSWLFQRDRRTAILTLAVPADQFPALAPKLEAIATSLRVLGGPL